MCGLTGIILGNTHRSKEDYKELRDTFTSMFQMSEERGHHASGIASMTKYGVSSLFKLPTPPSMMSKLYEFRNILNAMSDDTTAVIGHSRWRTVGSETVNKNNQPIVAGNILGTHNGTIKNATQLFTKFSLKRYAEVDSEILFRMADASLKDGVVDTILFKKYLSECEGSLSCVFVSKLDPSNIYILKGDKPLSLFYSERLQAILYASMRDYIIESVDDLMDWVELRMPEDTLFQFNFNNLKSVGVDSFSFRKLTVQTSIKKSKKTFVF